MTEAPPARPRARPGRIIAMAAMAIGVLVLVVLAMLYAARRQIAREAVTGWLKSKGVASETSFTELGPGHLVGRVRIGAPGSPDLTVERAEVDYSLAGLLAGKGVQVRRIRLVQPVLRAQWRGGRFSAGALDPLIADFRKRPPTPGQPSPRIEIDKGRLALATDYGLVRATADALIDNARLVRLDAATAPTRLVLAGGEAQLGPGAIRMATAGPAIRVMLRAPIVQASWQGSVVRNGLITLEARGGYPDLRKSQPSVGTARAHLEAASSSGGGLNVQRVRVDAASDWRWVHDTSDQLTGSLRLTGGADDVAASGLELSKVSADLSGAFAAGRQSRLRLAGAADARGGWSGLGAPVTGDSREIAALKRGLRAFRVSAQGLQLAADGAAAHARLSGPVRLLPDAGGEIRLVAHGGGYRLTSAGGGLPRVEADVRHVAFVQGAVSAMGDIKAALSIGPVEDGAYDASGELRIAGGETRFLASRCAEVKAAKLELGANDVERLATAFCPDGAPLLAVGRGGWSLAGRAEHASAVIPFLQARIVDGAGRVRLAGQGDRLSASLKIGEAGVRDTAKSERFRPLAVSGDVGLSRDLWTGELAFRLPKGAEVARAALRHDAKTGVGQVEIATGALSFRPGGLQPTDITPLAKPLGTAVQGEATFSGAFRWTPAGGTSGGELGLTHLDFKSPVGAVTDLSGAIRLTSLNPLIAPPGQVVRAQRIAAALPLTDVSASLAIEEKALVIARAEGSAGGGKLMVSDLDVPLDPDQPMKGALVLQGVQLHDLVEASPFGDRVDLDAKVSGRIPFQAEGQKIHIAGGELHAIAPGRLSIRRSALTSVAAQGSIKAPAAAAAPAANTDTFTDFAYQAMENLAFSKLDARVNTLPNGRLGVLFHIVGYHDPPKHQEITLSWWDLIRRKFLGRQLPLPSGTGVDLTLDTTLNLDDLLKDYANFERLKGSGPVQR